MLLLKFLREDGLSSYQKFQWSLPTQNADGSYTPGPWTETVDDISMCQQGYHASTVVGIESWYGPTCYVAEVRGTWIHQRRTQKVVAQSMRLLYPVESWNTKTMHDRCAFNADLLHACLPFMHEGKRVARWLLGLLREGPLSLTNEKRLQLLERIRHYSQLHWETSTVLRSLFDGAKSNYEISSSSLCLQFINDIARLIRSNRDGRQDIAERIVMRALGITEIPTMPTTDVIAA